MYNSCGPLHNSCIKLRHWPHDLISLEYLKQESARIFLSGMSKQKWTLSSLNLVGISGSGRNMIKKMRFSWQSGRGLVICLTFECRRSNGPVERIGVIQIGLKESQVLLLHKNKKKGFWLNSPDLNHHDDDDDSGYCVFMHRSGDVSFDLKCFLKLEVNCKITRLDFGKWHVAATTLLTFVRWDSPDFYIWWSGL